MFAHSFWTKIVYFSIVIKLQWNTCESCKLPCSGNVLLQLKMAKNLWFEICFLNVSHWLNLLYFTLVFQSDLMTKCWKMTLQWSWIIVLVLGYCAWLLSFDLVFIVLESDDVEVYFLRRPRYLLCAHSNFLLFEADKYDAKRSTRTIIHAFHPNHNRCVS